MDVSLSNALNTAIKPTAVEASRTTPVVPQQAEVGAVQDEPGSLQQAVSNIEGFVQTITRDLDFSLDDSTGRTVVKVTDRESGDVVRQIPSEEALRLAENLEQVRSLLFKAEA